MTALDVYLHDDRAGILERSDGAELRFTYDRDWLARAETPISLSLPLGEEPYLDPDCRPFFSGLLPEGEFLRSIARTFHPKTRLRSSRKSAASARAPSRLQPRAAIRPSPPRLRRSGS